MSVLSVNNLQETFIGKSISRTTNAQVTDPTNSTTYIADGEVVVIDGNLNVYNTGSMAYGPTLTSSTTPWIQVVQRNGDNLVWSNKIWGVRTTGYRGVGYTAGQEQVYHIGYDGVTATKTLDITAGLDFQLTVIENQDDMMWSEQKKKNVTSVPNNLVTSQQTLASYITKNVMKKYTTDGLSVTAAMLNSGTAAVLTGAANIALKVVHGSNVIAPYLTTTGAASPITNAGFGVGSIIRIGVTGTAIGTSDKLTCPVYTVQAAHPNIANAWILDQPYAGPSNAALAFTDCGYIATAGAAWGVRFTGKTLPYRRDFFKFKRVSFTLQMSGFGATTITKSQDSKYGYGDGRLVLEEESFSKGFEGALNRMSIPLPLANETFTASAATSVVLDTTNYHDGFDTPTTASRYNAITIEHYGQDAQTVVANPSMPQLIKVFMVVGADQGSGAVTDVQNALNDWMASTPSAFPTLSVF